MIEGDIDEEPIFLIRTAEQKEQTSRRVKLLRGAISETVSTKAAAENPNGTQARTSRQRSRSVS
jgi:hypothetical protein